MGVCRSWGSPWSFTTISWAAKGLSRGHSELEPTSRSRRCSQHSWVGVLCVQRGCRRLRDPKLSPISRAIVGTRIRLGGPIAEGMVLLTPEESRFLDKNSTYGVGGGLREFCRGFSLKRAKIMNSNTM